MSDTDQVIKIIKQVVNDVVTYVYEDGTVERIKFTICPKKWILSKEERTV